MVINISDFLSDENQTNFELSGKVDRFYINEYTKLQSDPEFELSIIKADKELYLNIKVKYEYERPCDRCLEIVHSKNNLNYDAKLVENKEDVEDPDIVMLDSKKLDIKKLISELIYLNLPTKLLCREDCRGICPTCGANLNYETCNCESESSDLRFDVLKNMFRDEEV